MRVIDEVDCFGTIAEIGLAYGARVPVHLFFGEALTIEQRYDFWFVARFAAHVHERISVNHAFARAAGNTRFPVACAVIGDDRAAGEEESLETGKPPLWEWGFSSRAGRREG